MLIFFKAVESKTGCVAKEVKFTALWKQMMERRYDYLGNYCPTILLVVISRQYIISE